MKSKKTKALRNLILLSMFVLVILQIGVIAGVFTISDTRAQLDKSAIQIFTNAVDVKAEEIEKRMVEWSDISSFRESIVKAGSKFEEEEGEPLFSVLKDGNKRQLFLNETYDIILESLRNSSATGIFVILEGEDGSELKDSVFLRDLNPNDSSETNQDLLLIAGSSDLMVEKGLTLDSNWSAKLNISQKDDFYYKPFNAGNEYKDIDAQNLGYWSNAFRLRENDIEIVSYAQPLLDSEHNSYGIIGISFSLTYINKFLETNKISLDNYSSYYLGTTVDDNNYKTVLVEDNYYKSRLSGGSNFLVDSAQDKNGLYSVNVHGENQESLLDINKIRLYNSNTPFENEQWVVAGFVRKEALFESSERFKVALLIACAIAAIITLAVAIIITMVIIKPIRALMNSIDSMDKPYDVKLYKTNIKEFDELAKKIEVLSNNVYKSGSRVANLLDMSDLPLGICEWENESNSVFCTKKFLEVAELETENWNNNYIPKNVFKSLMESFNKKINREFDEEDIFYFNGKSENKWLKIRKVFSEDKILVLILDVSHDMEERIKIKHDRDYDILTNLFNRRAFTNKVSNMIEDGKCSTGVLSVWDLDNLKFINDSYGHDMGDKYICLLASIFTEYINDYIIAARMSGDEFMVFVHDMDNEEMFKTLEQIHKSFISRKLMLHDGSLIPVSVSAGMVSINEGNSYSELFQYADFAMYEVKKKEKGGIKKFNKESHLRDYILVQGVGELNRIITEQSIKYVFQPIVDLKNKIIYGYEALMRPESEMLRNPTDFIRVAEAQSKLNQVEVLTWTHSIKQYMQLEGRDPDAKLFINSLPDQILSKEKREWFEREFKEVLGNIVMEITETEQINSEYEEIKRDFCDKHNMLRALDDFGAGYSNTDLLVTRNFDFVKLDMTLVRNIDKYRERQDLVAGVIQYCHSKNIKVIAEGIESEEELREVLRLGADFGQGYYFSRPVSKLKPIALDELIF